MSLLAPQHLISNTERVPKADILLHKNESYFWQKWHSVDHKGLVDAVRSSSNYPYTSKKDHEILKQQWMSLLVAHHPLSHTERVPEIWYISWKLMIAFGRNDTVWTIRGLLMLFKTSWSIIMKIKKVMKHSICDGCLPFQHSIPFPLPRGYL